VGVLKKLPTRKERRNTEGRGSKAIQRKGNRGKEEEKIALKNEPRGSRGL